jgi:hypothetical protein
MHSGLVISIYLTLGGGSTERKSSIIWDIPAALYLISIIHCKAQENDSKI